MSTSKATHLIVSTTTTDDTAVSLPYEPIKDFAGTSNYTLGFNICIVAQRTDVLGTSAAFTLEGCLKRGGPVSSTEIVGLVTKNSQKDTAATTWDVAATADTANGTLKLEVTGESGKTIDWAAHLSLTFIGA